MAIWAVVLRLVGRGVMANNADGPPYETRCRWREVHCAVCAVEALVPRKRVPREAILTALDSGKPAEERGVVGHVRRCILCRLVLMRVQMQSLMRLAALLEPSQPPITHATVSKRHTVAPEVRRDEMLCCSCPARTA